MNEFRDGDFYNGVISAIIDEVIHSERDRAILKRRLCDGILQERLAEEFGLSVTRVQQILYKGQDRVFKEFDKLI